MNESGQATAEYALVMVAAATVALALLIWATNSDVLPSLFNAVVRRVTGLLG
jgi:Flp pilus assembly pilin Flp